MSKYWFLLLTFVIGNSLAFHNKVHAPEVEKKYIQTEDIRAIIFNAVDGLNLYN